MPMQRKLSWKKSKRTSKDIEKWEDLIMNVSDMQLELENIEFKIKQTHIQNDKANSDKHNKVKPSDKIAQDKKPVSKHEEVKPRERTSPKKKVIAILIKRLPLTQGKFQSSNQAIKFKTERNY